MESEKMKNMIILKDLQSNIVEEAFVVLKNNVKIHKKEKIDKCNSVAEEEKVKSKDYMVKEAEFIINDYIKNIENKEYEIKKGKKNMQTKYKRLKTFTTILMVVAIISFLVAIFK